MPHTARTRRLPRFIALASLLAVAGALPAQSGSGGDAVHPAGNTHAALAPSFPADLLGGLTGWRLQLPTGPSNSASAVSHPTLARYSNPPYFRLNSAGTAVNFRAIAGGSRTSANTAYARTELREMQSNNTTPASWSCAAARRGLYLEQTLTRTTTHKAEASVAQIHDAVNDNLMVKYYGPAYPNANGASDTGRLQANFNNDAQKLVLDERYRLGDPMTIDVSVDAGKVTVNYRNLRSGTATITPAITLTGIQGGCYFKAGMYALACSKIDINGNTNEACVKKNWPSSTYETDPHAYSELEVRRLELR